MNALLLLLLLTAHPDPKDLQGCKRERDPHDAQRQDFVLKESDVKKNRKGENVAIVLFPRVFGRPHRFKRVQIRRGRTVVPLSFVYYDAEHGNPQRQIWRTESALRNLPKRSVLFADGQCWFLENPTVRID